MDGVNPRYVHAAFGVALAGSTAACLLGGPSVQGAAVLVAGLVPVAVVAGRYRLGVAHHPRAWPLLLAGFVALAVHNAVTLAAGAVSGEPYRGIWYGITLAIGYALLALGGLYATAPLIRSDPGAAIDTAILALAAAGMAWVAALGAVQAHRDMTGLDRARELVILLLVCAIAGLAIRAVVTGVGTRTALTYLALAAGATFAGTVGAALTENVTGGPRPWWVAAAWVLAYLAIAAVAVSPSSVEISAGPRPARLSRGRLVFLGGALALFPVMSTVAHLRGHSDDQVLLGLGSVVLVPLVVARIALLARMHASAEHRLTQLATHDDLTGLLNRRAVTAHVTALLAAVGEGSSPGVAVLFCDLDDFKTINDEHGHHVGDAFLLEVARRLRSAVRSTDAVARFGGDEFVLVLEGDPEAARVAGLRSVERALEGPVELDGVSASSRASVGTALARRGEQHTADGLLSAADAAMYRVKRARRSTDATRDADGAHVAAEPAPDPVAMKA